MLVDKNSDVPMQDFARQRMPSRWLALEANLEIWLAQQKSWLIRRPRSLSDFTIFERIVIDGRVHQIVLSETGRV